MRRAVLLLTAGGLAVVFAGLVATSAPAAPAPHAGPPPGGGGGAHLGPAAVQATTARMDRLTAAEQVPHRGKRLRVSDAATPPSQETAPAMSAILPLVAAPGGTAAVTIVQMDGARAPPAEATTDAGAEDDAGLSHGVPHRL